MQVHDFYCERLAKRKYLTRVGEEVQIHHTYREARARYDALALSLHPLLTNAVISCFVGCKGV